MATALNKYVAYLSKRVTRLKNVSRSLLYDSSPQSFN